MKLDPTTEEIKVGQFLFRYHLAKRYHDNEYDRAYAQVEEEQYRVTHVTPKGCWIAPGGYCYYAKDGKWKFILNSGKKRFAYPTRELAWESFKIRSLRRVQILTAQLKLAEAGLELSRADFYLFNVKAKIAPDILDLTACG
jgi:hypothetical protein